LETIESEICDWSRFSSAKKIGSYSGLCPGVSASGKKSCALPITKHGNRRLRTALIELAWRWVQWQPQCRLVRKWWKVLGAAKSAARQRKRAIVAMARQLVVDLWRWRTGKMTPEQLGWTMVED
jgi:transposase